MIPHHTCIWCDKEWPIIVERPIKCPGCQRKNWKAEDIITDLTESDIVKMVEYGQSHNFPCVLSPAWDKDNVGDLREDILTSISDGREWGSLIRDFLQS